MPPAAATVPASPGRAKSAIELACALRCSRVRSVVESRSHRATVPPGLGTPLQRWVRRSARALCCAVLGAATVSAASAGATPASAATGMTTDSAVRQRVTDQLARDQHLDASNIVVAASDGIVELSGSVGTQLSRSRAPRVAALVPGVRLVVNRLQWKLEKRADAAIAHDVRRLLKSSPATAQMSISVAVKKGVVTLTGAISSLSEQELAEQLTKTVPGVRFCLNNLTSRGAPQRTPEVIAADIRSRLAWDPATAAAKIGVEVERQVAHLSGVVGGELARRHAIKSAWVMGVAAVDGSGLNIDPEAAQPTLRRDLPSDQDVAKAVQDAIVHYWRGNPQQVSVRVVDGLVVLAGVVPTLEESKSAETLARGAVGAVDVRNELRGPWWKPAPAPRNVARRKRR